MHSATKPDIKNFHNYGNMLLLIYKLCLSSKEAEFLWSLEFVSANS